MQGAVLLAQRFVQPVQVGVVVLFGEEAGLAVVAALHDVQRDCVYEDAGAAGHGRTLGNLYKSKLRRDAALLKKF